MIVSLGQLLQQRVIGPLETISRANREQGRDIARPNKVPVPRDTPTEIREIVASRTYMLRRLFKSSEDRLQLIRYLRETFGRYYSDKILDEILKGRQRQRLGGKQEEVSILMCDTPMILGTILHRRAMIVYSELTMIIYPPITQLLHTTTSMQRSSGENLLCSYLRTTTS